MPLEAALAVAFAAIAEHCPLLKFLKADVCAFPSAFSHG
jgi:hypothetical protein